jgi:23S rRNA (guanosine2251-2'-O)-methyltransferase
MTVPFYEIRLCHNCGLRYPLTEGHPFGARCPSCLGETEVLMRQRLEREVPREGDPFPEGVRLRVLLDNLRSAWNVGSILRSADGFGFEHAYLCGITPTPEQAEVRKTALGAEDFITWSAHRNGLEQAMELQKAGWQVAALEKIKGSKPIREVLDRIDQGSIVMVVGNEVTGVDPEILSIADQVVHIPMRGQKRSFNVAVAFGAAAVIVHNEVIAHLGRSLEDEIR